MGRPMARTLRAGLPRATVLYVYDVSPGAMDACVRACAAERIGAGGGGEEKEGGGGARVVPCASCREVGERSVRRLSFSVWSAGRGLLTFCRGRVCTHAYGGLAGRR